MSRALAGARLRRQFEDFGVGFAIAVERSAARVSHRVSNEGLRDEGRV